MDIIKQVNIATGILICGFIGFVAFESIADKKDIALPLKPLAPKSQPVDMDAEIRRLFANSEALSPAEANALPVPQERKTLIPSLDDLNKEYHAHLDAVPSGEGAPKAALNPLKNRDKEGLLLQIPPGFFYRPTKSYFVYREGLDVGDELKNLLDDMYSGFAYDIMPFSVMAKIKKVLLMLFRTKQSYLDYTGQPKWSAAATEIEQGAISVMEQANFKTTVLHELTHIFYDGFFLPKLSPLWMSEGLAVYMQQTASPKGQESLSDNIVRTKLAKGEYIDFEEFTTVPGLAKYDKDDVALWYAQAYSVVKFLLAKQSNDGFYQFSKNVKEGMPLSRALYRAYGMPFNTLSALEYAWQADLQRQYPPAPKAKAGAKK